MAIQLPWLDQSLVFPAPEQALREPDGLLAAGGDLSPRRLLTAYRNGIFPWFSETDPILWWSPDPRCVFYPETFSPSRSLRKSLRNTAWQISVDHAFAAVIENCAAPRAYADDTWISPDIITGYCALHASGHAHSIEVWHDGTLVGGLYGVSVGGLFCGESMFSVKTDASKIAFWALTCIARDAGWPVVDAQFENPHLISLGAEMVSRTTYLTHLQRVRDQPGYDWARAHGVLKLAGFPLATEHPDS
ncbi:MAG: leucyl/phenylalanyl-tRNA--protein transferase [Pseudomonadota bacterium]